MESESRPRILVVDDEVHPRSILAEAARFLGYHVTEAGSGSEALQKVRFETFDLLITDLKMPGMDGIELLQSAHRADPSISVVVVTAHGTIETAVEAMKKGAEDYLLKPVEIAAFELMLDKLFGKRRLIQENRRLLSENEALRKQLEIRYHLSSLIGKSEKARDLHHRVELHMKHRGPLLLLGENGTGRSDLARMIHYNSPWSKSSLIFFDCSTTPLELHESQLFGEEGSTGGPSSPGRPGLIEQAHLGTLVLGEIHLLDPKCQARLVRVIQEEKTQRPGGTLFRRVQVRILATSRQEKIEDMQEAGTIHRELLNLLLQNPIEIPPVRERNEDIPILATATLRRLAHSMERPVDTIHPDVLQALLTYDFPGNMREMASMIESALLRCQDHELRLEHFPLLLQRARINGRSGNGATDTGATS